MMNDAFDLLRKLVGDMGNDNAGECDCDCCHKTITKAELETEANLAVKYLKDFTKTLMTMISTDKSHDADVVQDKLNEKYDAFKHEVFVDETLRMGTTFALMACTKAIAEEALGWYSALWRAFHEEMEEN